MLGCSLKIPSSTWLRALVPLKELRDKYQIAIYIQDPYKDQVSLLNSFISAFPQSSDYYLNLLFETQKRSRRLKFFPYKQEMDYH